MILVLLSRTALPAFRLQHLGERMREIRRMGKLMNTRNKQLEPDGATSIRVYTQLLSSLLWVVMPRLHKSSPFQGSYGQPRKTTPARSYLNYFGPVPQFCQISFIWLNPTGHSNFHNTSNTLCLLPTPVGLFVLSYTCQSRWSPPPYSLTPFFSSPECAH